MMMQSTSDVYLHGREAESQSVLRYTSRFIRGATNNTLAVVGRCGIGKTTAIKMLAESLQIQEGVEAYEAVVAAAGEQDGAAAPSRNDVPLLIPEFRYVNCASMKPKEFVAAVVNRLCPSTRQQVSGTSMTLDKLIEELQDVLSEIQSTRQKAIAAAAAAASSAKRKLSAATATAASRFVFLVLDEIDTIQNSGGQRNPVGRVAKIFVDIRAAGVILIANQLDLKKLVQPVEVEYATFTPYSSETTKAIASKKFGVSGAPLQLLVSHTENQHGGDMRKLNDIMNTAVAKKVREHRQQQQETEKDAGAAAAAANKTSKRKMTALAVKNTNLLPQNDDDNDDDDDDLCDSNTTTMSLTQQQQQQQGKKVLLSKSRQQQQQQQQQQKRTRDDVDNKISASQLNVGEINSVVKSSTDLSFLEGNPFTPQQLMVLSCVLNLYEYKYKKCDENAARLTSVHNGFSNVGNSSRGKGGKGGSRKNNQQQRRDLAIVLSVDEIFSMTQKVGLNIGVQLVRDALGVLENYQLLGIQGSHFFLAQDPVAVRSLLERNMSAEVLTRHKVNEDALGSILAMRGGGSRMI